MVSDRPRRWGTAPPLDTAFDRQRARARQALARAGNHDVRIDRLRRFDDGLRRRRGSPGGLEQRLADLPAGMQRRGGSFGRQQQPAGLQARSRRH